ncbi:MAG: hypothetical protein ABIU84_04945, partial [Thermoanaerobaculia bacterium]
LCPGTACVAAASGRGDGLAAMLGLFGGVLGFGWAVGVLPRLAAFYTGGGRGRYLLPELLGISYGATVLLIVIVALAGFALVERVERAGRVERSAWSGQAERRP